MLSSFQISATKLENMCPKGSREQQKKTEQKLDKLRHMVTSFTHQSEKNSEEPSLPERLGL